MLYIYSSTLNRLLKSWYFVELHYASTFGDAFLCKERGDVGLIEGAPYGFYTMHGLLLFWKIWRVAD